MIEIKSKLKYRIGGKAPKHNYRTRTGPNCCTGNCAKNPPMKGTGVKYSDRVQRRNLQMR